MSDTTQIESQLARSARVHDEELIGAESRPAARTLMAAVVDEPADEPVRRRSPGIRRRSFAVAGTLAAALTAVIVVGPSLWADGTGGATSYANSAIDVRLEEGYFVARITDPLADPERYVEAFRAVGKDVRIELVPVSPALIGQAVEMDIEPNKPSEVSTEVAGAANCDASPRACMIVIRVSTGTEARVRYRIGRAAQPGEAVQDPAWTKDGSRAPQPAGPGADSGGASSGGADSGGASSGGADSGGASSGGASSGGASSGGASSSGGN